MMAQDASPLSSQHSEVFDGHTDPPPSATTVGDGDPESQYNVYDSFRNEWALLSEKLQRDKEKIYTDIISAIESLKKLDLSFDSTNESLARRTELEYKSEFEKLAADEEKLLWENDKFQSEADLVNEITQIQRGRVQVNIGGVLFNTSLTTLTKDPYTLLKEKFSNVAPGAPPIFIDRDPLHFRHILTFLRDQTLPPSIRNDPQIWDELLLEARFYRIEGLVMLTMVGLPKMTQDELHRQHPAQSKTIFNLVGMDLSGLDFRGYHIDPRSNFERSNLGGANFEKASFGFDFKGGPNFSKTILIASRFPAAGSNSRPAGLKFNLTDALTRDAWNL